MKRSAVFAVLLLLVAAGADAQTDAQQQPGDLATPLPPPPPRKPAGQMDFGPLVLTPSIALMNVGVDNNIQNSQGQLESDLTMTVSPRMDVKYKSGPLSVELNTYLNYVFYKTYSEFGGFSPQINLEMDYQVARHVTFFTSDMFASTKNRPSVEIDPHVRNQTATVGGGFRIGLAPSLDLELAGSQSQILYAGDATFRGVQLQQTLDQQTQTASATFSIKLSPYTTLKTGAAIDNRTFQNAPERNAHADLFSAGLAFNPRALISGEASAGYRTLTTQSPTNPDYKGLEADGRLTLNLGDVTGFMVGGNRDLTPSFEPSFPYYVQTLFQAAIQQRIGKHFDVGPAFNAIWLDYRSFTDVPASVAATLAGSNVVRDYSISFGFLTNRLGRYAVYADHWERSYQNDPTRAYSDNRIGFMITSTRWLNGGGNTMQGFLVNTPSL